MSKKRNQYKKAHHKHQTKIARDEAKLGEDVAKLEGDVAAKCPACGSTNPAVRNEVSVPVKTRRGVLTDGVAKALCSNAWHG
jgi:hypothetical protein